MTLSTITYNSKAVKLSRRLIQDIENGEFAPGSLLPSQIELATKYHVSRDTIHRALSILHRDGQLQRLAQGKVLIPSGETGQGSGEAGGERKTRTIAAVWASEWDYCLVEISKGIAERAKEAGLKFTMFMSSSGHEKTLEILDAIETYGVDGVIVWPYAHPGCVAALRRLVARRFPLVCVDRLVGDLQASCVQFDNVGGVYASTHYLIDKYARPVYFVGCAMDNSTIQADFDGYRRAMSDAGFGKQVEAMTCVGSGTDWDPQYWPVDKKPLGANEGIQKFFDIAAFPASVVCINDYVARGVYEMAERRGLVIGRDVFVTGVSDLPLARFLKPSLTTVHCPIRQVGHEAVALLDRIMEGTVTKPVSIHLPVELVVREST